ncbi:hypothetical protein SERLA73DRAFT_173866 [Serpula lacrymans var. lacrymans S7.3]|uniref:NUDE domain-containing protein n=2 Tax=Serpula lacrymans var. lacrymans TaxID=341189 RepID=F8PHT9_SERL3|nr:uncharacterized protein SERLADRAFT_454785 [Serpula lacrymans var. lacrymans S7.9]EGO04568.1 hypothetical protein SERLA73DRAFT_173866 [Serpula lacrymans var. lacrymans S7.3]EGO30447.1 hypothetical protein SERLADRAFT_454785 [Serpula lacrymans var. lacrymans S7.9]
MKSILSDRSSIHHGLAPTRFSSSDGVNNSSPDWRAKFNEVADMLAETRAELDEFHTSSKELEEELIKELERTEKAQQGLKVKVANMETERDEWKSKFISLQTTHNKSTAFVQHELDMLRQENHTMKVQLRELEMGNDDLERNERAITSSLFDVEVKYSRALEDKILLEQDLLDKANLEEECQRLRDELRDANVEISILKDQLLFTRSQQLGDEAEPTFSSPCSVSSCVPPPVNVDHVVSTQTLSSQSIDLQLHQSSHPDCHLQDNRQGSFTKPVCRYPHSADPTSAESSRPNVSSSPSTLSVLPTSASIAQVSKSSSSLIRLPEIASKSKGVQMVSEMRARVRNLEQKIHTRVPRLRSGSSSSRQDATIVASTSTSLLTNGSPSLSIAPSSRRDSPPNLPHYKTGSRSADLEESDWRSMSPAADTSGWVFIMDDSSTIQSPSKDLIRTSSPFSPTIINQSLPPFAELQCTVDPSIRRPQSRPSYSGLRSTSLIPMRSVRPSTPLSAHAHSNDDIRRVPGVEARRLLCARSTTNPAFPPAHTTISSHDPQAAYDSLACSSDKDSATAPSEFDRARRVQDAGS